MVISAHEQFRATQIFKDTPDKTRGENKLACKDSEIIALLEIIEEEVFDNSKSLKEALERWRKLKTHIKELGLEQIRKELMI